MKVRFIVEILEDKLVIKNIKRVEVCARLEKGGYLKFSELTKIQSTKLQEKIGIVKNEPQPEAVEEDDKDDQAPSAIKAKEYDYLLGMNIWSLTYEKVEDLKSQLKNKTIELKVLEATTENEMWRTDIKDFLNEIDIVEKIELEEQIKADNKTKGTSKDKGKKQRKRVVKKEVSSDSEAEEKSKKKRKRKDDEEEKGQVRQI
jgi:DNA topoisomerase-2